MAWLLANEGHVLSCKDDHCSKDVVADLSFELRAAARQQLALVAGADALFLFEREKREGEGDEPDVF